MQARLLSPLLALALLLPGCVGSAAASATDALAPADEAALAWDSGAELAQAIALEGTFPLALVLQLVDTGGASQGDFERATDDEKIGDGLAEVWAYRYVADDKETAYLVVVDRDDKILREKETPLRNEDRALPAWTLDSDDALEIALGENDALADGIARDRFGVLALLHSDEGSAEWLIAGGGLDDLGAGGGFVRIDANTGAVRASEGGFQAR